jgi:hypothetical protein
MEIGVATMWRSRLRRACPHCFSFWRAFLKWLERIAENIELKNKKGLNNY